MLNTPKTFGTNSRNAKRGAYAAAIVAAAGMAMPAGAQPVLTVTGADVNIVTNGEADDWLVAGVDLSGCAVGPIPIPGLNGFDFGLICNEEAQQENYDPPSFVETITKSRVFVDGDGTSCITIYWNSGVLARSGAREGFFGRGDGTVDAALEITPSGVPDGTPLLYSYRIDVWGHAESELDACPSGGFPLEAVHPIFGPPDFVDWQNSVMLDGVQLLDPIRFNSFLPNGPFVGNFQIESDQVSDLGATGGVPIALEIDSFIESQISFWGKGAHCGDDSSDGYIWGSITICINSPGDPTPQIPAPSGSMGLLPPDAVAVFSVDIASANCLTDPTGAGVGLFDAGDAYRWFGGALPHGGANGLIDDAAMFGTDFVPTPGHPFPVPFCSGVLPGDPLLSNIFNMDAIDMMNLDVHGLLSQGTGGMPIFVDPTDPSVAACLNTPEHLFISMDDDGLASYLGDPNTGECGMPTVSASRQNATYGSDARQDEVIGLVTQPGLIGGPGGMIARYPVLSEERLHTSLGPSPLAPDQTRDNDVNGLDIARSSACDIVYFSADHAATGIDANGNAMRAGVVYQFTPGAGVVEAVDPRTHLGIDSETDINAIEFVMMDFGFAPPSSAVENEPCQTPLPQTDYFNGGCNSPATVLTRLELNQTMSAMGGSDGQVRDTDWYRIIVPVPGDYTLTVNAGLDVIAGFIADASGVLVNPDCSQPLLVSPSVTGAGNVSVTAHLPAPGEYWVFVAADGWSNTGCFDYTVVVEPPQVQTGIALAMLYSVDDDDPATVGIDESGGLNSGQIYVSFLNGVSFDYLSMPLDDNIDGLTSWANPLGYATSTSFGGTCVGDVNGDNRVDLDDLNLVLTHFGQPTLAGDANGDGVVDLDDLNLVLTHFGSVCP